MDDSPESSNPLRLAVLISGGGRTMVNLAEQIQRGQVPAEIVMVIASRNDASGIAKARDLGITTHVVSRRDYGDADAFSDAVWKLIKPAKIDLVCLAGFLSMLCVTEDFEHRVVNIHPALLPKYGGKGMYGHHVHEAVIAAGEKQSGCTVHLCTNAYDDGPIVVQRTCPVIDGDTADTLATRVFEQECLAYPQAIRSLYQKMRAS